MTFTKGSYVWIPDDYDVVIGARVEKTFSAGEDTVITKLSDGNSVKLFAQDTLGISQMEEQSLQSVDDMVLFKDLNENSILYNLRMRFEKDQIYTNVGRILTSVNPFKMLPLYTPMIISEYMEKGSRNMPPHVYGVADDAFNSMIDSCKRQSCIVSGELGVQFYQVKRMIRSLGDVTSSTYSQTLNR